MSDWKSKVLQEIEVTPTTAWQLQKSVSPDDKKFLSIRKVAKTKRGETKFTNSGFSLLTKDKSAVIAELKAVRTLVTRALKKLEAA